MKSWNSSLIYNKRAFPSLYCVPSFNMYYNRFPIVIIPKTHSASNVPFSQERIDDYPSLILLQETNLHWKWMFWKTKMLVAETAAVAGIFSLISPLCLEIRKLQYFINTKTESYINLIYIFNGTSPMYRWAYPPSRSAIGFRQKKGKISERLFPTSRVWKCSEY